MGLFTKATKERVRLRAAILGPAGSGKTYSALAIAEGLRKHFGFKPGSIAGICTERRSMRKYSHIFNFDVCDLESFHPHRYIEALNEAAGAGYPIVIIDSLSHAWAGKGGLLEFHDVTVKQQRGERQNSFAAWREVTPLHNQLVDAMLTCEAHLIVTMRTKTEYVQEKDENGKTIVRKIGLQPVQRDGLEYEFDVVGDIDDKHELLITKTRCEELDRKVIAKPGEQLAKTLVAWLSDGAPRAEPPRNGQADAVRAAAGSDCPVAGRPDQSEPANDPDNLPAPSKPAQPKPSPHAHLSPAHAGLSKLLDLCLSEGFMTEADIEAALRKRDAMTVEELTEAQATELWQRLADMRAEAGDGGEDEDEAGSDDAEAKEAPPESNGAAKDGAPSIQQDQTETATETREETDEQATGVGDYQVADAQRPEKSADAAKPKKPAKKPATKPAAKSGTKKTTKA